MDVSRHILVSRYIYIGGMFYETDGVFSRGVMLARIDVGA
jgi:hypothetical protein